MFLSQFNGIIHIGQLIIDIAGEGLAADFVAAIGHVIDTSFQLIDQIGLRMASDTGHILQVHLTIAVQRGKEGFLRRIDMADLIGDKGHGTLEDVGFDKGLVNGILQRQHITALAVVHDGTSILALVEIAELLYKLVVILILIYDMTRDSLRSSFGMVLQETWVFTGTVAENIAYGRPDATPEQITAAAKAVYAHGFIKRLPQGYDTVISENSGLSQGQKQLICIARIMLMDPPMLILDEATSSIDLRTEQRIQKAFVKLMDGRTSFVIAHRLSTIKNADTILVMNSGNIVEQGSHTELMRKGGYYSELYNSQFAS